MISLLQLCALCNFWMYIIWCRKGEPLLSWPSVWVQCHFQSLLSQCSSTLFLLVFCKSDIQTSLHPYLNWQIINMHKTSHFPYTWCATDSINIDHWHLLIQNFTPCLNEFSSFSIECCPFQKEPMDIDTLRRWIMNVIFGKSGDQILTNDAVQGPALVSSGHLLSHCCKKTLRIEESSWPENFWSTTEAPLFELSISF